MNQRQRRSVEGSFLLDEGWWSSLLADEDRYQERFQDRYLEPQSHPAQPHHQGWTNGNAADSENGASVAPEVDWQKVRHLFDADQSLTVQVTGYNRGGLLVEAEGMHGFVPVSHLVNLSGELEESQREAVLGAYIGLPLEVKVIECDPERGRVVFSERSALASAGRRNQLLTELQPGECADGVVTNITDFGIFVDLGGVEGLVHVSEISWGRVRHPTDLLNVGDRIRAYIIQVDRERSRIALSLKRLCSNPWDRVEHRYQTGQVVDAVVTSLVPYGAFARLEDGLDGLIHLSEMGPEIASPKEVVQEGQQVTVRILNIDSQRQRLGLSLHLE